MGHRDAGIGRRGDAGGDPRHHLHRHAVGREIGGLLAPPTEQERIAALEPHDHAMALGQLHQHGVGALLGNRMVAATLAHKVAFAPLGHQLQQGTGHQGIVNEGIALAQQTMGPQGEQLRIPRSGPHQIDGTEPASTGRHGKASRWVSSTA